MLAWLLSLLLTASSLPVQRVQAAGAEQNDRFYVGQYFSASMGKDMTYRVYLPEGYGSSERRYPTFYMLHGEDQSSQQLAIWGW